MESLKKLQAKVLQLTQSSTPPSHKKSGSIFWKKPKPQREKKLRYSRSMPFAPPYVDAQVWYNHPRPKYNGKGNLKPSDIHVVLPVPEKPVAISSFVPLPLKLDSSKHTVYGDDDDCGPTPPPKDDLSFQFPKPPSSIPVAPSSQEEIPVQRGEDFISKEDLLPPPPQAMFERMRRKEEARKPRTPYGPLAVAPSYEEVEDYVMRSEPAYPSTNTDREGIDRLKASLRKHKSKQHERGAASTSTVTVRPKVVEVPITERSHSMQSNIPSPVQRKFQPLIPDPIDLANTSCRSEEAPRTTWDRVPVQHQPARSVNKIRPNDVPYQDVGQSSALPRHHHSNSVPSGGRHERPVDRSTLPGTSEKPRRLPLGAHTVSSAYKSNAPDIKFMSPADSINRHHRSRTVDPRLPLNRRHV